MNILNGYKTYIVATLMVAIGVLKFFGFEVPSFETMDPGSLFMEGFAVLFLRKGISSAIENA